MKVRIFTDGACSGNPGPGGWAAIFNTDKECNIIKGYEENTTNNRMELTAVVMAMERIHRSHENGNVYELFSDSAYVVNSINNAWIKVWKSNDWKTTRNEDIKNKDLWDRYLKVIEELNKNKIVLKIIKIKGHTGNAFNEYVDKLAKEEVLKAKKYGGDYYA